MCSESLSSELVSLTFKVLILGFAERSMHELTEDLRPAILLYDASECL